VEPKPGEASATCSGKVRRATDKPAHRQALSRFAETNEREIIPRRWNAKRPHGQLRQTRRSRIDSFTGRGRGSRANFSRPPWKISRPTRRVFGTDSRSSPPGGCGTADKAAKLLERGDGRSAISPDSSLAPDSRAADSRAPGRGVTEQTSWTKMLTGYTCPRYPQSPKSPHLTRAHEGIAGICRSVRPRERTTKIPDSTGFNSRRRICRGIFRGQTRP